MMNTVFQAQKCLRIARTEGFPLKQIFATKIQFKTGLPIKASLGFQVAE
jgi:hypothetical protein